MKTQTKTMSNLRMRIILLLGMAFSVILLAAVLSVLCRPTVIAHAATSDSQEPSYTKTDKLYLRIPDRDKVMEFKTLGNVKVVADGEFKEIQSVSSTFRVRQWFDVYIQSSLGWYVDKADEEDGKYYYDPVKYPLHYGWSVNNLGIEVSGLPQNEKMYTFFCGVGVMDCGLWSTNGESTYTEEPCACTVPSIKITDPTGGNREIISGFLNLNPQTNAGDCRNLPLIGVACGGDYNMAEKPLGAQPKSVGLGSIACTQSNTVSLMFDYCLGAMTQPTYDLGYLPLNANRAPGQHDHFAIDINVVPDTTAPALKTSDAISQSAVSATWMDSAYSFATYTRNGIAQGEYTSGKKLTEEGKYVITVTDAVGNKTVSEELIVDKTPPTFANDFYDAQGKQLIKYTKENSYTLPFPTSGANESAIEQTATYVYSYYDSAANKVISMPAEYYENGDSLTKEGRYVITVSDAAGNSSNCTVIIDRSPPTFTTLQYSKSSVYASYSASDAEGPITATYTLTTASGTSGASSYRSGMRLSVEGCYDITATDSAGNSSSITLYVDSTAPTLSRSFEYGNTNGDVTFAYSEWESPITAVYTYTGADGTLTNVPYTSGQALSADGEYTVTATDYVGNSSSIRLVVDRKAPTLIFADGTTGTSSITRSSSYVAWSVAAYESPVSAVYSFASVNEATAPSVDNAPYTSGNMFTAEGTYSITATDRAGNVAQATLIIDNTPPTLTFSANGISFERYTNSVFTAVASDTLSGVDKIELYENGQYVLYDFAPRSGNGAYLFRVTDRAGNYSSGVATVYTTDTFGNLESIRDSYKINAWYTVTLPARIFTTPGNDVAGRYSFESYDKALEFAVAKEREFRVTPVQGGYMYVSASNESVAQKYDDEKTLNAAIEKYAKGYISARQIATANGSDKFFTELESLTRNSLILPDYLLELKDLPRYYARPATVWSLPNISYISEMPYTVTAKYLGDYAEETTQKEYVIPSGATLLSATADYKQGYYLITERDAAGNVERYIIYSDAELPTARVNATFGDGDSTFVLDESYARNEALYFIAIDFEALLDNTDTFITLKLEKGNTVKYFTQDDELPMLGSEEYTSGKYTVTIFDRSLNALVFDVYIAGAAPVMTHSSLAEDKSDCKISFVTSDRYNVITSVTLYKIEYDGTKTTLEVDGLGTPVTAATLSYTLIVGGKYGATVTDNYRRTVELTPIFFLKGLPSGKLTGVKDGGRTNKNVSFTFDSADVAELYTLHPNGERQRFYDYTVQAGSSQTTYNVTADDTTSFEYLVFLHNAQDLSLFVEYTFEIDTVLPAIEITDSDGNVIEPDGATNKPFSIKWSEASVSIRYYTSRISSLSPSKYDMNTVLSQGALYYFTLKDDVGNTLEFTVLLDNVVDYELDGNYNVVDGVLYSNGEITLTVNEPTQEFSVVNADGYTIDNGGTLTQAGRYDITVMDNYRNTVTLCIVLDFDPPVLTLVGADNGAAVKNDVTVSAFDYDYLYLTDGKGNKIRNIEDGEIFTESGMYYITAEDYCGNAVTVSFSIDLSVDYTLSVPFGAVTTGKVTLDTAEPLTVEVKLDGVSADSAAKFTATGFYELTLTDGIGNSVSCVFVILPERAQTFEQDLPAGTRIVSVIKDGAAYTVTEFDSLFLEQSGVYAVTLDCSGVRHEFTLEVDNSPPVVTLIKDGSTVKISAVDKENVTLKLTCDGAEINCNVGKTLDEAGHYVLTATDELGNVSVYEFEIPFRLNAWAIVAIIIGCAAVIVVVVLVIRARRKPRMK